MAKLPLGVQDEVLAYMVFPERYWRWRQIHSTNPLQRLHKELKRRAHVVGTFPNRAAALRLIGTMLVEQSDDWAIGRRRFSAESIADIVRTDVPARPTTAAN